MNDQVSPQSVVLSHDAGASNIYTTHSCPFVYARRRETYFAFRCPRSTYQRLLTAPAERPKASAMSSKQLSSPPLSFICRKMTSSSREDQILFSRDTVSTVFSIASATFCVLLVRWIVLRRLSPLLSAPARFTQLGRPTRLLPSLPQPHLPIELRIWSTLLLVGSYSRFPSADSQKAQS